MTTVTYNSADLTVGSSIGDVYQAPSSGGAVALVTDLRVTNRDGSNSATLDLVKTDSSNTILSYILPKTFTVPVQQGHIPVIGGLFVLKAGQKIRAVASTGSRIDVSVSVREET